jgi:hypothetical protein
MKRLILMGGRPWLGQDGGKALAETLFRYFPGEVKLAFFLHICPTRKRMGRNQALQYGNI